jgi:hypothetical protein
MQFITMGSPIGLPVVICKIATEQKSGGTKNNQSVLIPLWHFKKLLLSPDLPDVREINNSFSKYLICTITGLNSVMPDHKVIRKFIV